MNFPNQPVIPYGAVRILFLNPSGLGPSMRTLCSSSNGVMNGFVDKRLGCCPVGSLVGGGRAKYSSLLPPSRWLYFLTFGGPFLTGGTRDEAEEYAESPGTAFVTRHCGVVGVDTDLRCLSVDFCGRGGAG